MKNENLSKRHAFYLTFMMTQYLLVCGTAWTWVLELKFEWWKLLVVGTLQAYLSLLYTFTYNLLFGPSKLQPVPETRSYSNRLPNGFTLVQHSPAMAVSLDGGEQHGWLFKYNDTDHTWEALRLLESWEIMQAEDQRDYGYILTGTFPRQP